MNSQETAMQCVYMHEDPMKYFSGNAYLSLDVKHASSKETTRE